MFKLERVFLLCLNNHFIILLNINTFYAFFLQKIKTYYLYLILTSFLDCVIREILGSVLKPLFLCKCCGAIRREEVFKQVGCERERLTLYINNTNFPLINMQQLKQIIFQDLLNEPRTYTYAKFLVICKPRTLNDGGEDTVKYRNRKKAPLISSSHFAFYR